MLQTICVCEHAFARWKERVGGPNAVEQEVVDAVREARLIKPGDFLPMPRLPHTHYYHHQRFGCYFIIEPVNRCVGRLVTVVIPTMPTSALVGRNKRAVARKDSYSLTVRLDNLVYRISTLPKGDRERKMLLRERDKLRSKLVRSRPSQGEDREGHLRHNRAEGQV